MTSKIVTHGEVDKPTKVDIIQVMVSEEVPIFEATGPARKLSIVGLAQEVVQIREIIAVRSSSAVHIHGESGTGKDLLAREIHDASPRRYKPFVVVDCGTLTLDNFQAQLFGTVKINTGSFVAAHEGTLFLDEVHELKPEIQVAITRVLESRQVRLVGEKQSQPPLDVDFRVVSATKRDLVEYVKAGTFRPELLFRLNVLSITLPPLRTRKNEISGLVKVFIKRYGNDRVKNIASSALEILYAYDWPGNVRELEGVIERACAFSRGDTIAPSDLPHTVLNNDAIHIWSIAELQQRLRKRIFGEIDLTEFSRRFSSGKLLPIFSDTNLQTKS